MHNKKLIFFLIFFFIFLFTFCPLIEACGYISNVAKDSKQLGLYRRYSHLTRIEDTNYYLVSNTDGVDTIEFWVYEIYPNNGTLNTSTIDSYNPGKGCWGIDTWRVSENIYATMGSRAGVVPSWYLEVYTIKVLDNGTIDGGIIDTLVLGYSMDLGDCHYQFCGGLTLDNGVSLVLYRQDNGNPYLWLESFTIDSNGYISDNRLDSIKVNDTGYFPKMIAIGTNTVCLMYNDVDDEGWLKTYYVTSDGDIGDADDHTQDSWNFATQCNDYSFNLFNVYSTVYGIVYHDGSNLVAKTFNMQSSGTMTKSFIDSMTITSTASMPTPFVVGNNIFGVAHRGDGNDGFINTFNISQTGYMTDDIIDTWEYYTADIMHFPSVVYINDDYFAIISDEYDANSCYDGWGLYTFTVECATGETEVTDEDEGIETTICSGTLLNYFTSDNRYQEFKTDDTYTGLFTEIKILYKIDQLTYNQPLVEYWGFVNGINVSAPSEWDYYSSEYIWLIWELDSIPLNDDNLIFEWTHNAPIPIYPYTYRHILADGESYNDLDKCDHQQTSSFGDGEFYCEGYPSMDSYVVCFTYYNTAEPTYTFTFSCDWSISNPIEYNNYWDIFVYVNEPVAIAYLLRDSGGINFYEGVIGSYLEVHHISNVWIDQDDQLGTYTFYVVDYETYQNAGFQFPISQATFYQFNVTTGTTKEYNLKTNKKQYYQNEFVGIYYRAPSGVNVYIKAWENTEPYDCVFNTSVIGTGDWVYLPEEFQIPHFGSYFLYMYWVSNNTKIPHTTVYIYTYSKFTATTLKVEPTQCYVGDYVTISGTQNFEGCSANSIYLEIFYEGAIIHTINIQCHETSFTRQYQCKYTGKYYVLISFFGKTDGYKVYWDCLPKSDADEMTTIFIGLMIIIVLFLMGFGIANKISGDDKIVIPLFFGTIGAIISVLFELLPMWIIFILGLILGGWIVKRVLS